MAKNSTALLVILAAGAALLASGAGKAKASAPGSTDGESDAEGGGGGDSPGKPGEHGGGGDGGGGAAPGPGPAGAPIPSARPPVAAPSQSVADDVREVVEAVDAAMGKPVPVKPAPSPVPVKPAAPVRPSPVPVKPAAPVRPSPVITVNNPNPRTPPGYDQRKASNEAKGLAAHIQQKQYNFSRPALKTFQTHAGIKDDGIYGPLSESALKYYAGTAPKALAKGAAGAPTVYTPPGQ